MNKDHIKWAVFGGLILLSFFCLSSSPETAVPVGAVGVALAEGVRRRKKAQVDAQARVDAERKREAESSKNAISSARDRAMKEAQKWLDS